MNWARVLLEWVIPIASGISMAVVLLGKGDGLPRSRAATCATYFMTRGGMLLLALWICPVTVDTDLPWFRQMNVDSVLHGNYPGREFPAGYGPFLPLLQTLGVLVTPGHSTSGVLLPFLAGDLLALYAAGVLDARQGWAGRWRSLQGWILLSPAVWQQMILRGQDEVLLLCFLMLSATMFAKGFIALSGAAFGFGILCTKVSLLPYGLGFFLLCPGFRQGFRFISGAMVSLAIGGVFVMSMGIRPISWDLIVYQTKLDGISITDVIRRVGWEGALGWALLAGFVVSASLVGWACARLRTRPPTIAVLAAVAVCHSVTVGFMPSTLPAYLVQGLPFQYGLGLGMGMEEGVMARILRVGTVVVSISSCLWWTRSHWFGHSVHTLLAAGLGMATVLLVLRRSTVAQVDS